MDNKTYLELCQQSNDKEYKNVIERLKDHHKVRLLHAEIGMSEKLVKLVE